MHKSVYFLLFICLVIGVYFISWAKITTGRSHIPKVHVDLALTQFTLSPTNNVTLSYNLPANITYRNPSSLVGITFYKTNVYLMYQGQLLGTKRIQDTFYLKNKKEKSIVNVGLVGQHDLQLNHGDETMVYASDNKHGAYLINVKLRLKMKFKALGFPTKRLAYQITCNNMLLPLSSEGNVSSVRLDIARCTHKEIDIKCFDVEDGSNTRMKYCPSLSFKGNVS